MDHFSLETGFRVEHAIACSVHTAAGGIGLLRVAQSFYDSLALRVPRLYHAFSNSINRVVHGVSVSSAAYISSTRVAMRVTAAESSVTAPTSAWTTSTSRSCCRVHSGGGAAASAPGTEGGAGGRNRYVHVAMVVIVIWCVQNIIEAWTDEYERSYE